MIEKFDSDLVDSKWTHQADAFVESHTRWLQDEEEYLQPLVRQGEREVSLHNTTIAPEQPSTTKGKKKERAGLIAEVCAAEILLPSSCSKEVKATRWLEQAVRVESGLRKGQANDMLDDVRSLLIADEYLRDLKAKPQSKSQAVVTRLQKNIQRKAVEKRVAANGYRRAREALARLGVSEADMKAFPELRAEDVRAFTIFMGHAGLGQSREAPSWIWGDISFVDGQTNFKDCMLESRLFAVTMMKREADNTYIAVRAFWFRTSALHTRWHEEILLVPEEMRRTVRFHYYFNAKWLSAAKDHEDGGDRGRAAYARK